ncbi:unnamed protein product [Chilo suppressalis]|uniref:DNA-directed RNA polymerase III subunit RPC5 n=1 Tax=Chilo suppressalis TaxID=168631 RepID=A0ABN8AY33_CHISP|nr:unnamed protein product [Chilo suppressalis]
MEEEDPVVQEIPVYLSKALAENLYVYQYPVRPANRDWKDLVVTNAAIKPKNQLVRLEVGLATDSDKYCPSKGEQIAINTDGQQEWHTKTKDKSKYFRSGMMDKIVYESCSPCTETGHYAVAILQDKELHCTPIQGIVQMRPSYSYYDKQDKRKSDKNKADNSDDEEKEKEPEAEQVTVKFARQETDVAKKAREKSFETVSQRINDEPWYDAMWKDAEHAELERLKLFSMNTSDGSALTLSGREYVRVLVPPPPDDEADVAPAKLPTPQEQLKEILINAKLMKFNDLRAMVRTEDGSQLSEASLLSALSVCACCVRGLWTARSSCLYTRAAPAPPRLLCAARDHVVSASDLAGLRGCQPVYRRVASVRVKCLRVLRTRTMDRAFQLPLYARDHVLYLFTQHPYIDRRKVAAAVRLPPAEVLEIISSVAKFNPRTGWELIIPPDVAFEAKYPDVVQRQNLYWEARQRQFNEMLIGENVPKRQRKKSQRESVSSDTMMSPKPRCNSITEEDSERKRQKNKSATGGGKRTRNFSSSSVHDAT